MIAKNIRWGALAATAMVATTAMAPVAAHADWRQDQNTQKNKNLWRNLGIGGAALGAYGLLNHNSTLGLLGAAGAAYSANRYEQDRHHQSQDNSRDQYRYYHRDNYNQGNYNRYNLNNFNNYRNTDRGYNYRQENHPPFGRAYGWHRNHGR